MSQCIPWDALAEGYYQGLSTTQGRPSKDDRALTAAVTKRLYEIVRHPSEGKGVPT